MLTKDIDFLVWSLRIFWFVSMILIFIFDNSCKISSLKEKNQKYRSSSIKIFFPKNNKNCVKNALKESKKLRPNKKIHNVC